MSNERLATAAAAEELRAHILMLPETRDYAGLRLEETYRREEAKLRQQAATMSAFARRQGAASNRKAAREYERTAERSRMFADAIGRLAAGKSLDNAISEALAAATRDPHIRPGKDNYTHGAESRKEAEQLGDLTLPTYTVFVDPARIEEDGDIHRVISAVPGYMREGKIKRPLRFGGANLFVAICAHFDERGQEPMILALRAVPPSEYDGQPAVTRIEQLPAETASGPAAAAKDLAGKVFTYGSREYVLTPPILFIQKRSSPAATTTVAAADTQTARQATDSPTTIAGTDTHAVQTRAGYTCIPIATTAKTGSVSPDDTSPDSNQQRATNRPKRTGTNTESQPPPANLDGGTHLRC